MNNPVILKGVSILAFIISAIFTILLMTSGTVGIIAWILTVGMAIVLELCKVGFFYESLSNTKLLLPIRILLGIIAILLVGSSIFASASYVQNQANKTKNIQTKDSSQYKQLEQGKAVQQDLYNVKKKEIEDLKALQGKQQSNGDSIISTMPRNYIDKKNQAKQDTATQISKTQDIINSKSTELSQIGASLQSPIDTTNLKLSSDSGYTAMFKTLADYLNKLDSYKGNPINAEELEMWFFIGLGVIFEMVAILTAYLSQLKGASTLTTTQREAPTQTEATSKARFDHDYKPMFETKSSSLTGDSDNPTKRIIGFHTGADATGADRDKKSVENPKPCVTHSVHEIDNQMLGRYLTHIYANIKRDNSIDGYQTCGKALSLPVDVVRKLKNHCEHLQILESDSIQRKTFILKPKDDAFLSLGMK
jgi:hypothetical protein